MEMKGKKGIPSQCERLKGVSLEAYNTCVEQGGKLTVPQMDAALSDLELRDYKSRGHSIAISRKKGTPGAARLASALVKGFDFPVEVEGYEGINPPFKGGGPGQKRQKKELY